MSAGLGRGLPRFLSAALLFVIAACAAPGPMNRGSEAPRLARAAESGVAWTLLERPDSVRVGAGDTLFSLTAQYHVSFRALIEANDLAPPFALQAGQVLRLPPPNTHRVEAGESLTTLARRYRVHEPSLALMNGLRRPYALRPGDVIVLPALARDWRAGAQPLEMEAAAVQPRFSTGPETLEGPVRRPTRNAAARPFLWPLDGEVLARFGPIDAHRRLDGVKIAARPGQAVKAARDGVVVFAGDGLPGYGALLLIRHEDDWISAYGHNSTLWVGEGERVRQGDLVAEAGATGRVTRPQLHFELRRRGRPVDPLPLLPRRTG